MAQLMNFHASIKLDDTMMLYEVPFEALAYIQAALQPTSKTGPLFLLFLT